VELAMLTKLFGRVTRKIRTYIFSSAFGSYGGGEISRGFQSNASSRIYCGDNVFLNEYIWISFGDKGELVIEDDVYIGRFCTMSISGRVTIKKNALISDRVFIGDCNHGYKDLSLPIIEQEVIFSGTVEIGEGCWIGIGVCILPGVSIGKNSVIGANSVVTHNVPDYCIALGNPARVIKNIAAENE
jgi:acetyltransferase-like isoleucine patch superfamily enzyme